MFEAKIVGIFLVNYVINSQADISWFDFTNCFRKYFYILKVACTMGKNAFFDKIKFQKNVWMTLHMKDFGWTIREKNIALHLKIFHMRWHFQKFFWNSILSKKGVFDQYAVIGFDWVVIKPCHNAPMFWTICPFCFINWGLPKAYKEELTNRWSK